MISTSTSSSTKPLAVVTGASSGVGRALAEEFARRGFDLFLTSCDAANLADVERDIQSLGGIVVGKVGADLTEGKEVDKLFNAIQELERPLEAVAINAGFGLGGAFVGTDLERELKMIALNVTSSVHLAKHVTAKMVEQGRGKVLFTSSIAAVTPGPYEAVYAATKAFLKSFSESLHGELKDKGIAVTALMPGPTETNFFHKAEMDDTSVGGAKKDDPDQVASLGLDALFANDSHVVAGSLKTRLEGWLMENVLPESAKSALHVGMAKPGSGK